MSEKIRRQSIISSVVIYFGFAIGLLNTFFFTKQGLFTAEQYGLTNIFIAVASLMATIAAMGMPTFVYKFYPYYNDNLEPRKNDMMAWSVLISITGFIIVLVIGIVFKDFVYRKYSANSILFVKYYYWVFPFAFGLTVYNVLETYAWSLHKSVLTSFLKEVEWRLLISIFIVLFICKVIPDFDTFIKLYALTYLGIAVTLLLYLIYKNRHLFVFEISRVTRRFFKKIARFCFFIYGASIVFTLSQVFDSLVIASVLPDGMKKVGIYGLAQIVTSLIQVPQRGIIAASIPHLSQAWKNKNLLSIKNIYQRSSINQLIFALLMLILITLNYKDAVTFFHLKPEYLLGFNVFILLGLMRVVDMGTGVNSQIIGTSNYWRFELISGIILLLLILPLNYFLTKQFDIEGTAIANLISITVYNIIRIIFLWYKYKLFPFNIKSIYTVLLAGVSFLAGYYLFKNLHGLWGMVGRSMVTVVIFGAGVVLLKLTPDLSPVLQTMSKRFYIKKKTS
jgi:O-antigen/teichoic acid export membrane protein